MPNLPRLKRPREAVETAAPVAVPDLSTPRIEEIEAGGLRWFNVERPGPAEQAWLGDRFDFHPLDIEDVFSRNQRPKIDEYPDYLFLILHIPVFNREIGRLGAGVRAPLVVGALHAGRRTRVAGRCRLTFGDARGPSCVVRPVLYLPHDVGRNQPRSR